MNIIETHDLCKQYGNALRVAHLDLDVPEGSVYGFLGPNGAGKSTALRHATGICRPDKGQVYFDGLSVYENPQIKSRIAYIPDEIFFFPSATLEDMRKFYRGMYPTFDDGLFTQLLDVFPQLRKAPISRYSKGMQKQAAFWLAISCRPQVLILDEPVDGLDPVMRRQIMGLILEDVAEHGTTVLVSSHNLRELEDICDHVGIMNKGKILLERSLSDLQDNIVKLQVVWPEGTGAPSLSRDVEILHTSQVGRVYTYIVRGNPADIKARMAAYDPLLLEALPLSLEEIFIYEMGGEDYGVRDIVL